MKTIHLSFGRTLFLLMIVSISVCNARNVFIKNNSTAKLVTFGNSKCKFTLEYKNKCRLSRMEVNGEAVISNSSGVFSEIRMKGKTFSTLALLEPPSVKISKSKLEINGIKYGERQLIVEETWSFMIDENDVEFVIERKIPKQITAEEVSFPSFHFDNIKTWEGSFLGNGGVAWFYLFNEKLCTYGVHTNCSSFWNSKTDNGLKIVATSHEKKIGVKFSRSNNDELIYNITVAHDSISLRYDEEDTHRRRFIREKTDVWSPLIIKAGIVKQSIKLTPFNYHTEYNRGKFVGINGEQLTSVLNTIARIGVIDSKLYGGNSWHTPYGPICLHEQYIAQFGIAINDSNYINGYKECLDYYKVHAIRPDGRVLPRWAYDNSDAMPGTATPLGFYEAQWGYLLDSNPDFVADVAQLFNLSGDLSWVKNHKRTCEQVLDYMLKRDSNKNYLVEMMTNSHLEKRGSDWIDIIWASYENAFVNAKLYYALTLWSDVEKQIGDREKSSFYSMYATNLKKSFNKSTADGGFWDERNKWYVHWRDKDNSIHGNNLTIPVNFMAISYEIYDDANRRAAILDKIEDQMQKEHLFMWPICLYSYEKGEGRDNQFPFPHYENGDIFLSWGAVGVDAYAGYKPELALKYIENIMAQHSKDGLAFQRYGRAKQNGLGDDILSGNCLAIIGLYQSIYGINPLYNRLYLNPHLADKLNGTELNYNFRNDKLKINLNKDHYSISNSQFCLASNRCFGYYSSGNELFFFDGSSDRLSLKVQKARKGLVVLEINKWNSDNREWTCLSAGNSSKVKFVINGLNKNEFYSLLVDGEKILDNKVNNDGLLTFDSRINSKTQTFQVIKKEM
jgi:hypothetical protein